MKKVIPLVLFIMCIMPFRAHAEEIIKKGSTLTLQQCLDIAATRQPAIAAAQYVVDASRSRVGEAQSNYYPQISADASYSRIKPLTGAQRLVSTGLNGTSVSNATSSFNNYTGSVSLNQNIYDFGKTSSQVDISRLNLDASRASLDNTFDQVAFNVKQAYYGVLQAQRNSEVAVETVKQYGQHLQQAKGFYEVGTHPKYDVTTAEVNLSNAKLNLIKAENALKVAKVTLNNVMGVPDAPQYDVQDNLAFEKYSVTMDTAVEEAYKNRPDLQSLIAQRKAAERNIALQKTGYYPVLAGNAAYNLGGEEFPLNKGWSVGVGITVPIFSGFLTKKQVEEARANLSVVRANEESLKQSILLDVQQAYLNLVDTERSISTAELTVKQATENLEIADGRYAAGVGNPIEVTDAEVSLTNAKTSYIQALYSYKIAQASLEKAMGMK
jgi:outer membrane protein